MTPVARLSLALWAFFMVSTASAELPRQMPRDGELSPGEVVLVDDGRCPRGEVKQVTGGNKAKNIPREVRCVPRPQ
jgi:hypothetical protein